jgi:hypothetical protein
MIRLVVLALLSSATIASAGPDVSLSDSGSDLSQTRNFRRGGGYESQWSQPAKNSNALDHEGRAAGSFEDGGKGLVRFGVKAGADGKAVVSFQDVGDTKNFKSFTVNGQKVDIPEPRKNGSFFRVVIDFGREGWHKVIAATTLRNPRSGLQDGFSVCRG